MKSDITFLPERKQRDLHELVALIREDVAKALASLSKKDLDDLIKDEEPIEVKCHFCNENYVFSPDDLREIRK